jgi:hypothetical protein
MLGLYLYAGFYSERDVSLSLEELMMSVYVVVTLGS